MLFYKDRTYCPFGILCRDGYTCDRALTDKIKKDAEKFGLPISQFNDFPECFVPFFEKELI